MKKTALKLLTILLITKINTSITFALMVVPQMKSCFREWFPEGESVAISYEVEDQSNLGQTGKIPNPSRNRNLRQNAQNPNYGNPQMNSQKPNFTLIHHFFFDAENQKIGELLPAQKDTFTYVTHKPEIISICVENYGNLPILVHYNISMNVYNNDHSRVATKDHLRKYEEDILDLEEITNEMINENKMISDLVRKRFSNVGNVSGMASTFAGFAVIFIFVVKLSEILFLRKKLQDKKII